MPLRVDSLGELRTAACHARMLVQGVPVCRRRQRNGQRVLPYGDVHGHGPHQRLPGRRGQRQPDAPAILPDVRDAALQRGRSASSSDLRSRRHFRRSRSRASCDDDLDVVCPSLGVHRRRFAPSREATAAGGVMESRQRADRWHHASASNAKRKSSGVAGRSPTFTGLISFSCREKAPCRPTRTQAALRPGNSLRAWFRTVRPAGDTDTSRSTPAAW